MQAVGANNRGYNESQLKSPIIRQQVGVPDLPLLYVRHLGLLSFLSEHWIRRLDVGWVHDLHLPAAARLRLNLYYDEAVASLFYACRCLLEYRGSNQSLQVA